MHPGLSFEQAPPISVPFRFFLAAPCFGILAGVLLAIAGEDALSSRWMPQALALTHLIAAGFMLQSMSGALMQFIPVAVGGNVWRPRLVASIVQPLLVVATLLLTAGLYTSRPDIAVLAVAPFAAGIGLNVTVLAAALWRTPANGPTLWALRLATAGLAVTTLLGAVLVEALAHGLVVPLVTLTDVHLAWGLGGWALMLLAGVSYHVVPMFQMTRPYPLRFARAFGPLLMALLLAWTARLWFDDARWSAAVALPALVLASGFAGVTLRLQYTRRRKAQDATALAFRISMLSLLTFAASYVAMWIVPALGADPRASVWLGVLALGGVFVPAITGMTCKIVSFVSWLHLQRIGAPAALVPNMKQIIPGTAINRQLRSLMVALTLLAGAVWVPVLARPAGVALAVSFAWLGWNLCAGMLRYRWFAQRLRAGMAKSAAPSE